MMQVRLMFARGMVGMIDASVLDAVEAAVLVDHCHGIFRRSHPRGAAGVKLSRDGCADVRRDRRVRAQRVLVQHGHSLNVFRDLRLVRDPPCEADAVDQPPQVMWVRCVVEVDPRLPARVGACER
jgi:hypothetical protein